MFQDEPRKLLYSAGLQSPHITKAGGEVASLQLLHHWKTTKTMLTSQYRSKSLRNITGTLLNQCLNKDSGCSEGQKSTYVVIPRCVIKLSVSVFTILVKDYTLVRLLAELFLLSLTS